MIISFYDDYLNAEVHGGYKIWNEIKQVINKNNSYRDLLNYWASREEDDDGNLFKVSQMIRE